ncbi:MAG: family 43 glycosylhydrolase [Bacilli bacterium]|jgi:arabinoxylan arabinofuranohydrolase|nr:family 43 glycosylhydrolase [Bacilli bacterium]
MVKQVYNPYLPLYEYIPDGEPHVYDGRLFVYGSHDQFGAFAFCHNDYVSWSAPLDDLSDWRFEGLLYSKKEDPDNKHGHYDLYAPDVTLGPDGRYYVYYEFGFKSKLGVAVSDSPQGPFHYLGHVHFKDGHELGTKKGDVFPFDPGVLTDEDKRVYLYVGFGPDHWFPQIRSGVKHDGCYAFELEPDMLTIKDGPHKVLDRKGLASKEFQGHEFFEASSIRKINGLYYLSYSSINGHELCYSTSSSPFGPFTYGGTLVSNGDVFLNGRTASEACYPLGNNHGGLVNVNGQWYIFYHRHTNYTNTDRQGMAEKIVLDDQGHFHQAEMTSCGLNGGPLKGQGLYPASICCLLKPKGGNVFYPFCKTPYQKHHKTYLTQSGPDDSVMTTQYIHDIHDKTYVGYKYFDLSKTHLVGLYLKGKFSGTLCMAFHEKGPEVNAIHLQLNTKHYTEMLMPVPQGASACTGLFFRFSGKGSLDFNKFELK